VATAPPAQWPRQLRRTLTVIADAPDRV
jgi:hypothetical protein